MHWTISADDSIEGASFLDSYTGLGPFRRKPIDRLVALTDLRGLD